MKSFFQISRGERNGSIILIIVFLLLVFMNIIVPQYFSETRFEIEDFEQKSEKFFESMKPKDQAYYEKKQIELLDAKYDTIKMFKFDPNKTTENEWFALGLSVKQVRIIQNFIKKGGFFKTKSDFEKVYGISLAQYRKLEDWIDLPEGEKTHQEPENVKITDYSIFNFNPNTISKDSLLLLGISINAVNNIVKFRARGGIFKEPADFGKIYNLSEEKYKELYFYIKIPQIIPDQTIGNERIELPTLYIELNAADTTELKKLKGIGSYYAKLIIKYRNLLGGFHSIEQLLEVYTFKEETFEKIKNQIYIFN